MLTLLPPGDFVNYFLEFSEPTTQVPATLQAPQDPPPADILATWLTRLSGGFGVEFA